MNGKEAVRKLKTFPFWIQFSDVCGGKCYMIERSNLLQFIIQGRVFMQFLLNL